MFNFGGITHLNQNPTGTFSYVGSVPASLGVERKATAADAMAGRSKNGVAIHFPSKATVEQAVEDAKAVGAKLCSSPTCACRKLF